MRKTILLFFVVCAMVLSASMRAENAPKREFRGSWIQCVNGQFMGMGRDAMQAELTRHLDALQKCHVNAVFFQVRAEADALYPSEIEPWSRFLTGVQGQVPNPFWDPLQWMIDECHKRGMELHAWINPYRAKTANTVLLADNHPFRLHPERFFQYGKLILFNPALEENRRYICNVVADIVRRYDVDGIHIDDYFYPYPEAGQQIPDQNEYARMGQGFASIGDWRRDNVSRLVRDLHHTIHSLKPWVKFGVAPFGIYHNQAGPGVNRPTEMEGNDNNKVKGENNLPGSNTRGLQNYDDLYADVLQWTSQGWVDYNIPQIYWEIGHPAADYDTLIHWWAKYMSGRPLFIGQDVERTVRAADLKNPNINQLPEKWRLQRSLRGVSGNCLWYSAAVANNTGRILDALSQTYQNKPALQPCMTFIDKNAPSKPAKARVIGGDKGPLLVWLPKETADEMQRPVRYAVYRFPKGKKANVEDADHLLVITPNNFVEISEADRGCTYLITALDRLWNESKPRKAKIK